MIQTLSRRSLAAPMTALALLGLLTLKDRLDANELWFWAPLAGAALLWLWTGKAGALRNSPSDYDTRRFDDFFATVSVGLIGIALVWFLITLMFKGYF